MNREDIVRAIDDQIVQLQKARSLLASPEPTIKRKPGQPAGTLFPLAKQASLSPQDRPAKRRPMSLEARAKIAAAQRARWAKSRKAARKTAAALPPPKSTTPPLTTKASKRKIVNQAAAVKKLPAPKTSAAASDA